MTEGEVTAFFRKFVDHLDIPIADPGAWKATGLFKESGMAPEASQGDLRKLVTQITRWAKDEPDWLS
jgi:hypothetical protein